MNRLTDIVAKILSVALYPLFVPTYGISLFCYAYSIHVAPMDARWILIAIIGTFLLTCVLPITAIWIMMRRGEVKDLYIDDPRERTMPYIYAFMGFCFWSYLMVAILQTPLFLSYIAIGATVAIAIVAVVNRWWKISAHLAGFGGLVGGLFAYCIGIGAIPTIGTADPQRPHAGTGQCRMAGRYRLYRPALLYHDSMRKIILTYLLMVAMTVGAQTLSDQARISLITCTPGEELYARYGHTAIRVCDEEQDLDVVFNYGIFDFNTDHFYWKFVKGETWYELGASPYWWFMREYDETARPVYEQVLNLNATQREAIWQALVTNYQPENRKYLYNFVFDNCATRPFVLLEKTLGDSILSDYTGYTGETYRRFIRRYTPKGSWADFGINLLFGPRADQRMNSRQRLFLPEELMQYMSHARYGETPIVASEQIGAFVIQPLPWYKTWYFGLAVYFVVLCLISLYDRKRQRWSWGIELAVGIPYALLLLIVTFLTFFSCHPLVGFGWRLLILPLTHLCARFIYIAR